MTTHYNVDDLGLEGIELERTTYSLREDYSMKDLQEPEDLLTFLIDRYGENFEHMTQETKFVLISIVSAIMADGGRFCDHVISWPAAKEYLPVELLATELNTLEGAKLIKRLANSLNETTL